ncbi:MAG: DUF418 domain-containing protein [Hellea sp.]
MSDTKMGYIEQSQAAGRHILPDLVRAFALFGIVLVNVAYFAYPGEITYYYGDLTSALDKSAYFGVNSLFLFKSYTLFSFMFGAGLAYQMMSAERRGIAFSPRYFRRLIGLILLGIAHVTFGFVGDILIIYAVLGALLFFFRHRKVKTLLRWGISLVTLQILIAFFGAFGFHMGQVYDPEGMAQMATEMQVIMDKAAQTYTQGSFGDIMLQRWTDWKGYIGFAAAYQGPGVLGFFLLGLAAVKSGVLNDASAPLWGKARKFYLPLGLVISIIGAFVSHISTDPMSPLGMVGMAIIMLGAPFSSLGYLGWLAKWSEGPMTKIKIFMARGGTSSLTAYLMQSLILSFIFCAYGLGLYGQIGAAGCIAIAAMTGIITLGFSSLWRKKFTRGPMEYLLRGWTYWGRNNS